MINTHVCAFVCAYVLVCVQPLKIIKLKFQINVSIREWFSNIIHTCIHYKHQMTPVAKQVEIKQQDNYILWISTQIRRCMYWMH